MKRGFFTGSLPAATVLMVCAAVCALLSASSAQATDADMIRLPVANPHLCHSCHLVEQPGPGNFDLNPFGEDFLSNGRLWDSNLANLDSDGDGCLNGVEVGDSDGDGEPDGNVDAQAGNPGVHDECGFGFSGGRKNLGCLESYV